MKALLSCVSFAIALQLILACQSDQDCNEGECCAPNLVRRNSCKRIGVDSGDACGKRNCPCSDGFICVPHTSSIWNRVRPSEGTCQNINHTFDLGIAEFGGFGQSERERFEPLPLGEQPMSSRGLPVQQTNDDQQFQQAFNQDQQDDIQQVQQNQQDQFQQDPDSVDLQTLHQNQGQQSNTIELQKPQVHPNNLDYQLTNVMPQRPARPDFQFPQVDQQQSQISRDYQDFIDRMRQRGNNLHHQSENNVQQQSQQQQNDYDESSEEADQQIQQQQNSQGRFEYRKGKYD